MTIDKRSIKRRRVLKSGKIVYGDGAIVLDCAIRNLTVEGAQLDVPKTVMIPQSFTLRDTHAGRSYLAKVIWRRGTRMGVEFTDEPEDQQR